MYCRVSGGEFGGAHGHADWESRFPQLDRLYTVLGEYLHGDDTRRRGKCDGDISVRLRSHSSASSLPSVGLYFSGLDFFAGTRCEGLGLPTRSRAISRTALAAVKVFFFLFLPGLGASWHRTYKKSKN